MAQDTTHGKANDTTYAGLPSGTSISDVRLSNLLMYGMKLGHYFNSMPWLGVELESFVTIPPRPQQPHAHDGYQAVACESYVGVGPGLFFLRQQQLHSVVAEGG